MKVLNIILYILLFALIATIIAFSIHSHNNQKFETYLTLFNILNLLTPLLIAFILKSVIETSINNNKYIKDFFIDDLKEIHKLVQDVKFTFERGSALDIDEKREFTKNTNKLGNLWNAFYLWSLDEKFNKIIKLNLQFENWTIIYTEYLLSVSDLDKGEKEKVALSYRNFTNQIRGCMINIINL